MKLWATLESDPGTRIDAQSKPRGGIALKSTGAVEALCFEVYS